MTLTSSTLALVVLSIATRLVAGLRYDSTIADFISLPNSDINSSLVKVCQNKDDSFDSWTIFHAYQASSVSSSTIYITQTAISDSSESGTQEIVNALAVELQTSFSLHAMAVLDESENSIMLLGQDSLTG